MGKTKLTDEQKALKKQEEELQRVEGLRLRNIKDCIDTVKKVGDAPNERKVFQVGETVKTSHHGLISAIVLNILSEGVYEVRINYRTTKPYSSEYADYTDVRVYGWYDVFKATNKECYIELGKHMRIQFMQQTIQSLIYKYFDDRGLDMSPPYQRGIVWTDKQKEELLTSIFNHIDIGKFVFIYNKYESRGFKYTILDGKQKLQTIVDFYSDKFTYKGYYYSELGSMQQHTLLDHSISIAELQEEAVTEEMILDYFIRLNTMGTPMKQEHIDKVIRMRENLVGLISTFDKY
jgi:hypothetical protein